MGILQDLKSFLSNQNKKEADFLVTEISSFEDYSSLNDKLNYLDQYEGWTYKAIKIKADTMVNYTPYFYKKQGDKVAEINSNDNDGQLLRDLFRFNKFLTYQDARRLTWIHLGLTGTAFWLMTESNNSNYKVDFEILNPTSVFIRTDKIGYPREYVFRDKDGAEHSIDPENLIVFREPNPKNWLKGYGALQASRYAHNTYELASKFNMNVFGNSGRPEMLLVADGITEPEQKRLEKKLKQKYGGVKNARKIGVVNKKLEVIELMKMQKELDYVNSSKELRKEILAMHGVPIDLLGLGDTTYANAQEASRTFQRYTIAPMLSIEASVYNEQLIPKYYGSELSSKFYYFEFENPVEADSRQQAEEAKLLFESTLVTRNEAREMVDLPPLETEEGEEYFEKSEPINLNPKSPQDNQEEDQELEKKFTNLSKELKTQSKLIKSIPDVKEKLDKFREEEKLYFLKKNLEAEDQYKGKVIEFFDDQMIRIVEEMTGAKAITLKIDLNLAKENKRAMDILLPVSLKIANDFNNIANEKTGDKVAFSKKTKVKIARQLAKFINEFNKTTQKDLRELIITKGITEKIKQFEIASKGVDKYTGYVEGEENVAILKKYGVYIDRAKIDIKGKVVMASGIRYNKMLEKISKTLTGDDRPKAIQALVNLIDPSAEYGTSTLSYIKTVFGITPGVGSRSGTISVTQTNSCKNLTFRDNFAQNKYVVGFEWLTAHDDYVRGPSSPYSPSPYDHISMDGVVAEKGKKFYVSGDWLEEPGDPSGDPGNIINCRCTLVPVMDDEKK